MIHIVYETTNLVNGRKYIGKHSTNDINDGYLGSGNLLFKAVKKYGKENFVRTILKEFNTEEEAYLYEEMLITSEIVKNNMYYNIREGGNGFNSESSTALWQDPEYIKKKSESLKKLWEDPKHRELVSSFMKNLWKDPEYREKMSEHMKNRWKDQEYREKMCKVSNDLWKDPEHREKISNLNKGEGNPMYGKHHTEEAKAKIRNTVKKSWEDPISKTKRCELVTGENNPRSKLTDEKVKEIKNRIKDGERNIDIAEMYNISKQVISKIKTGRSWRHIK
jgi:anti-sigma28 factor (negative regulator of flagellin synthesis)